MLVLNIIKIGFIYIFPMKNKHINAFLAKTFTFIIEKKSSSSVSDCVSVFELLFLQLVIYRHKQAKVQ